MNETNDRMNVFDQIKAGLEDSIAYSRGELSLVTTELPAPPPNADPGDVAALRRSFKMSQAVFAAVLNVSTKTVQSWEQGVRAPSDAALRMLQVIRSAPEIVSRVIGGPGEPSQYHPRRRASRPRGRRPFANRRSSPAARKR